MKPITIVGFSLKPGIVGTLVRWVKDDHFTFIEACQKFNLIEYVDAVKKTGVKGADVDLDDPKAVMKAFEDAKVEAQAQILSQGCGYRF